MRRRRSEVIMASTREDEKPWKTDLARKSKQRREQVVQDIEEAIKKAPSFEEALRQAVEIMKKKFAATRPSRPTSPTARIWRSTRPSTGPRGRSGSGRAAGRWPTSPTAITRRSSSDLSTQSALGWGRARHRQRPRRAGSDRGRPLGDPRDLERFPRRLHAAGREAPGQASRAPSPRRPPRPKRAGGARGVRLRLRRDLPAPRDAVPRRRRPRPRRLRGQPRVLCWRRPRRLPGPRLERRSREPRRGREAHPRPRRPPARGGPHAPRRDRSRIDARHHRPDAHASPTWAPTPPSSSRPTTTSRR